MDEFRVGSIYGDPYHDDSQGNAKRRKKHNDGAEAPEKEDIVVLSTDEAREEDAADYYAPSSGKDETGE